MAEVRHLERGDRAAGMGGTGAERRRAGWRLAWPAGLALAACSGSQSALDPAGSEAERVAQLFWVMLIGTGVIWSLVIGAAVYAARVRPGPHDPAISRRLIHWGGIGLPVLALTALLAYGLQLMPELRAAGDGLKIEVSGEQWWWRVRYQTADGRSIVSANEIRLPAGERVELTLASPDVIHSLWIPNLAGKVDMIPGRVNRLVLEPNRVGSFRGVCAEFCGASHALMAFAVVVVTRPEFEQWLSQEAAAATGASSAELRRGAVLFEQVGCGGCHAIRGTAAAGTIGPDLTHLASRRTLAAGILPNEPAALRRWIAAADTIKPGVRMPSFGMLPAADLDAIVAYLASLE